MTTMCCHTAVAVVSGKCGGNTANATDITEASKGSDNILAESGSWQDTLEASDPTVTFQYACGTGKTLKANPATIPLSGANAAAKTAVCCDDTVGTCAGIARPTTAPPQLSHNVMTMSLYCALPVVSESDDNNIVRIKCTGNFRYTASKSFNKIPFSIVMV